MAVPRGNAPCSEARRVLRRFYTGGEGIHAYGEHHNPPRDLAETYWIIEGWKCGTGAGAVGCLRGPRNMIEGRWLSEVGWEEWEEEWEQG